MSKQKELSTLTGKHLLIAATGNHTNSVLGMLKDGVDPGTHYNPRNYYIGGDIYMEFGVHGDNNTALHCAAIHKNAEMFAALVKAGQSFLESNYIGESPIGLLMENHDFAMEVVERSDGPREFFSNILYHATREKWYRLAKEAITKGAVNDVCTTSGDGSRPLHMLVEDGEAWTSPEYKDMVRQLILNPASDISYCNQKSLSAFETACQLNHWEAASLIVAAATEASKDHGDKLGYGLYLAAEAGQWELVLDLLRLKDPKVNYVSEKSNATALHLAALAGREDVFRALLESGATVRFESQCDGPSVLYFAKTLDDAAMVESLILSGANLASIKDGGYPFSQAELDDLLTQAIAENKFRLITVLLTHMITASLVTVNEEVFSDLLTKLNEFDVAANCVTESGARQLTEIDSAKILDCLFPLFGAAKSEDKSILKRLIDFMSTLSIKSQLLFVGRILDDEADLLIDDLNGYLGRMAGPIKLRLVSDAANREMVKVFKHVTQLNTGMDSYGPVYDAIIDLCGIQLELAGTLKSYDSRSQAQNRAEKYTVCSHLFNLILEIKKRSFEQPTQIVANIGRPLLCQFLFSAKDLLPKATVGVSSRIKKQLGRLAKVLGMPADKTVDYSSNILIGSTADVKRKAGIQKAFKSLKAISKKYEADHGKGGPVKRQVCKEFLGHLAQALENPDFNLKYRVNQLKASKLSYKDLVDDNDKSGGQPLKLGATRWDAAVKGSLFCDMRKFFDTLARANYFPGYRQVVEAMELRSISK